MEVIADQPFQILLQLVHDRRLDPWEVDIEPLFRVIAEHMLAETNMRLSGRAILSASTLLRIKSEVATKGNGYPGTGEEPELATDFELPELGQITVIQRAPRKITIAELMGALAEALREAHVSPKARRKRMEKIIRWLDGYHINIERHMERLCSKLVELSAGVREVAFSEIPFERTKLGAVRTLLLLLFLGARGKIALRQEQHFGEIFISLS